MLRFLTWLFGSDEDTAGEPTDPWRPFELTVPKEFGDLDSPDWIVEFKGIGLPHGGRYRTRTQLWIGTRGTAVVNVSETRDRDPLELRVNLSPREIEALAAALQRNAPSSLRSVESGVLDGMPARVALYRREPPLQIQATCNLAVYSGASVQPGCLVSRGARGTRRDFP